MSDDIRLAGDDDGPRGPRGGSGRIQVRQEVLDEIDHHVSSDTTVEQGGVLVGDYHEPSQTIMVTGRIPAVGAISDVASLRFTHETWDHINAMMDQDHPGRRMVGWYHSHPHFGIFLSDYDQFIHQNFFREPWQVAYVVDPLLGQRGFFAWVDGELIRVASWATWRTDRADGEGPIGTPPPRSGPPPQTDADTATDADPGEHGAPRRTGGPNPWAVGGFVLLLGALLAAVLVVIRPFAGAEPATIRIENLEADDPAAPLTGEAVAGTVTPIGRVALEGIEEAEADSLSWTYHPTGGAAASESVVVETTTDPGTYEVTWHSDGLEDAGASTGELRASVCLVPTRPPAVCGSDDLRTAALATEVVVTGDPLPHLSAPSPDRFVDADGHWAVPDERLVAIAAGAAPPSLPDGVRLIASEASPDSDGPTIYQFGVTEAALGALATAVGDAPLVPHVGFTPPDDLPDRPDPVLPDGIVRSTESRAAVDLAPVATVTDARRAAALACGEDGISAACGIVDVEGRPDAGPVALASLIEMIDAVPDGSVAPVLVDAHPDGCPAVPPDRAAADLVADRIELRSNVLWVVGDDGCRGLVESLAVLPNVVVVQFDPAEDGGVSVPGGTDLADAVAIVAGAAADGWSLDLDRSLADLAACLKEDGRPVGPDDSACAVPQASDGSPTGPPTTATPSDAQDEEGSGT